MFWTFVLALYNASCLLAQNFCQLPFWDSLTDSLLAFRYSGSYPLTIVIPESNKLYDNFSTTFVDTEASFSFLSLPAYIFIFHVYPLSLHSLKNSAPYLWTFWWVYCFMASHYWKSRFLGSLHNRRSDTFSKAVGLYIYLSRLFLGQ